MSFIKTVPLLTAIKTYLEALTVASDDATLLFEEVVLFHTPEMGSAIKRLLLSQTRICLIVPSGDDYQSTVTAGYVHTTAELELELIFADRVWSTTQNTSALFGGGSNIGVVPMKDRVVESLTGADIGIPGVVLAPLAGSFVTVKDDQDPKLKDSPGRESYMSSWSTWAGEYSASTAVDGFGG